MPHSDQRLKKEMMKGKVKIEETKVGSEYRVRDASGDVHGEFDTFDKAKQRAGKLKGAYK